MKYYFWGPLLTCCKVSDDIINKLTVKGDELTIKDHDWSANLAGDIREEKAYPDEFTAEIERLLIPYFSKYIEILSNVWKTNVKDPSDGRFNYKLTKMWINYQRRIESNPIHSHSGDLSFVIYVDVPKAIHEEKTRGQKHAPGSITFTYGYGLSREEDSQVIKDLDSTSATSHVPVTGEMFIFPSWLPHYVLPFYSDVVRKSVSGNLHFRGSNG